MYTTSHQEHSQSKEREERGKNILQNTRTALNRHEDVTPQMQRLTKQQDLASSTPATKLADVVDRDTVEKQRQQARRRQDPHEFLKL